MEAAQLASAYHSPDTDTDPVRDQLEAPELTHAARRALASSGGAEVLELGCAAGLGHRLAGPELGRYVGVDWRPPTHELPGDWLLHDLREGLGPVESRPFDLYLGGFGLASHLTPDQLGRLLREIAAHARPGSVVAIEALGLHSLEWPGLWGTRPGIDRMLPYRLGADVTVHPWAPAELAALMSAAGMRPVRFADRSLQTAPKLDCGRYWPGLPALRATIGALLRDEPPGAALSATLPPLPAGQAAAAHQRLAERRRTTVAAHRGSRPALARRLWQLERGSAAGLGHGLMAVARVA